ncbi:MAG TPA: AMP-binding protein [Actinopolymorphaceae bacterium]|jgi:acetyl-CoA synthetase
MAAPTNARPTATQIYREARDFLLAHLDDYHTAERDFAWPQFDGTFNWATDWFDHIARDESSASRDRTALWIVEEDDTERSLTFSELAFRSDQVAAWLEAQGVTRGDRVLLMLGNQVELWESMLAIMKLGAIIVPTTTLLGPADLTDRITRGEVSHVIVNSADTPRFDDVPGDYTRICVGTDGVPAGWRSYVDAYQRTDPPRRTAVTAPDDTLLLYFTSGTTSKPKLVRHTQVSYPVGHMSTMYWLGLEPGDIHLNVSSPGWAKHAWSSFFAPWIAEATIFVYNYTRFDAAALLRQIHRAKVTSMCAPPTVWRMLIQADLSGGPGELRKVAAAGEPLNPEVIEHVRRHWNLTIRDGYGQTETSAQIGNSPGQEVKPGSMGRPLPGMSVVLVDPVTGQPSDEGEICLDLSRRPACLMSGYLGDPSLDAEAMAGGYYHTGDLAERDADGYITYVGRTDDVFKASDYKVSPFELESVLLEHPAVAEAAVVPAPDPVRLAVPKAYVALAAGHAADEKTAASILSYARERLPAYNRVRRIEFVEALPKTISGKIRRVELRERETKLAADGERPPGEFREDILS